MKNGYPAWQEPDIRPTENVVPACRWPGSDHIVALPPEGNTDAGYTSANRSHQCLATTGASIYVFQFGIITPIPATKRLTHHTHNRLPDARQGPVSLKRHSPTAPKPATKRLTHHTYNRHPGERRDPVSLKKTEIDPRRRAFRARKDYSNPKYAKAPDWAGALYCIHSLDSSAL